MLEDDDWGWEREILANLAEGHAYVLIFLRMWEELSPEERENRRRYGLPPNFFASSYRIIDACLTNSTWVWFGRHIY